MHGTLKSGSTGAVTAGTLRVLGGEMLLPVCTETVEGKPRGEHSFRSFLLLYSILFILHVNTSGEPNHACS